MVSRSTTGSRVVHLLEPAQQLDVQWDALCRDLAGCIQADCRGSRLSFDEACTGLLLLRKRLELLEEWPEDRSKPLDEEQEHWNRTLHDNWRKMMLLLW